MTLRLCIWHHCENKLYIFSLINNKIIRIATSLVCAIQHNTAASRGHWWTFSHDLSKKLQTSTMIFKLAV